MRRTMYLMFLLLFIFSFLSCSQDNLSPPDQVIISGEYPLIIVLGQSNAEGLASKDAAPNWLADNNYILDDYIIWNKDYNYLSLYELGRNVGSNNNADSRFGFDIFFAKQYLNYYGGKLICLKHTLAATPISEKGDDYRVGRWQPNVSLIRPGERRLVEEFEQKLNNVRIYASKNNLILKPIAILYHQGESDATNQLRLADYKVNLTSLIICLRNILKIKEIPIINADIMYKNDNFKNINTIFRELNDTDPYLKTVDMSKHQQHLGDTIHYNANSFEYMGDKMFEYYQLLNKAK